MHATRQRTINALAYPASEARGLINLRVSCRIPIAYRNGRLTQDGSEQEPRKQIRLHRKRIVFFAERERDAEKYYGWKERPRRFL